MVRKLCPTAFLSSDMGLDPLLEPTHEVSNCTLVVTEQDIQKQEKRRCGYGIGISERFAFIYGYCEDENILIEQQILSSAPSSKWEKYFRDRRYRTLIDFKPSDTAEVLPVNRDKITALRLQPRQSLRAFDPVTLTCSLCHEQDLRLLKCNNEILKTVLVCYNIYCHLTYIFIGNDSFISVGSYVDPIKIPSASLRRKQLC